VTLVSRKFFLRRDKMPDFLNELEDATAPVAMSVYLPPGLSILEIEDLISKAGAQSILAELSQLVANSGTGAVLFWGNAHKCLILPPFPFREKDIFAGYVAEPLRLLLNSDLRFGLILVHLGSYAVGVCEGEKLVTSKVGTGLVHGRNKKGGSSQQRFQRHRQNQIQKFLDRVCVHVLEQLEPHAQILNYIAYGGPRYTILLLQKRCLFLKSFEDRVLPLLDVPSLNQKVLETTVSRLWASCIIEWREA
jgi:hypothetical protein